MRARVLDHAFNNSRVKIERLFAWLQYFCGTVTRHEYHAENFLAMIQLARLIILLSHLLVTLDNLIR